MKTLLDGEIMYYLEHSQFFPAAGDHVLIPTLGATTPATAIQDVETSLKITIPQGHNLEYLITNYGDYAYITIRALFPLFKDGHKELHCQLDKSGKTYTFSGG